MKALVNKFFIFYFLFFILLSCSSVSKEYLTNDDICNYNDPIFKITKEEMIFDVEKYDSILRLEDLIIKSSNIFEKKYSRTKPINTDVITYTNKQTNKQTNIIKYIGYNAKGEIQYSRFSHLEHNFYLYKETNYNHKGKIIKQFNHRNNYKICLNEAIEIIKQIAKKDIKKYKIKEFYVSRNDLNEFPNDKPLWHIGLMNGNEKFFKQKVKKGNIRYVIDGITGKLIKTYRIRISH